MRIAIAIIFFFVIIAIGVGLVATVLSKTSKNQAPKDNQKTQTGASVAILQVSRDGGKTFSPLELPGSISLKNFGATALVQDPDNGEVWWMGTTTSGILQSSDNGRAWQSVPGYAAGGLVTLVRVPNSDALFVATVRDKRGRIMYSQDRGATFKEAYSTPAENVSVTALAVDQINTDIIYATTSDGLLLRSQDKGQSWEPGRRFPGYITRIVIPKISPQEMYIVVSKNGVYHSSKRGEAWDDLVNIPTRKGGDLRSFTGGTDIFEFSHAPNNAGEFLLATTGGILHSQNFGVSYTRLNSIILPSAVPVLSVSYDPRHPNVIFATAGNGLYRTDDDGLSWSIFRFETPLRIFGMALDRRDGQTMFLALGK